MNLFDILGLSLVMVVLALIPSTSVALVVIRSSTAGFVSGAAATAGIVFGDLLFVILAILGMSALAEAMGGFFLILKYLAGAYLVWFGINLLKPRPAIKTKSAERMTTTLSASFFAGLLITLGDIKAIFFYASLFPAFVDPASVTPVDITAIIAVTLITVGGVKLAYAYGARKVTSFTRGYRLAREARTAAGCFMVGAGTYLVVKA